MSKYMHVCVCVCVCVWIHAHMHTCALQVEHSLYMYMYMYSWSNTSYLLLTGGAIYLQMYRWSITFSSAAEAWAVRSPAGCAAYMNVVLVGYAWYLVWMCISLS